MAFGRGDNRLLDQIFNLKFTSKQLVRASKKCEQEEKEEKSKARRVEQR
jgi:charged multivesicular body protein 1